MCWDGHNYLQFHALKACSRVLRYITGRLDSSSSTAFSRRATEARVNVLVHVHRVSELVVNQLRSMRFR